MRTKTLTEISILGAHKDKPRIISTLQRLGVVHIEKATSQEQAFSQDKVQRGLDDASEKLLRLTYIRDHAGLDYDYELETLPPYEELRAEAADFIKRYEPIVKNSSKNRKRLAEELDKTKAQADTLKALPQAVKGHLMGKDQLLYTAEQSLLFPKIRKKVRFVLRKTRTEEGYHYLFTLKGKDANKLQGLLRQTPLKRIDIAFLTKPADEEEAELEKKMTVLGEELQEVEKDLKRKLYLEKMKLPYLITSLENYRDQFTISTNFIATKNLFALKGYCEEKDLPLIREEIKDATIMKREAGPQAPTKLSGGKLTKNFQAITEMFGLPGYGKVDPTPLVAFFYPFFFGFMLSDIGYGLFLLLIVGTLRAIMGKKFQQAYVIFGLSGLSSIVFGILFGSFFGNLIHMEPLLIDSFSASFTILKVSLAIGLVHLNIGAALNMRQLKDQGERWPAIIRKAGGFFLLEIAGGFFALKLVIPGAITLGALIALLVKEKGGFGLMDLTGYFGTWFSYARLLALSLATAGVALAINIIAGKALALGKAGIVLWAIIIIAGHVFNFAINVLGSAIHAARLHYVEFFSLFFEGEGKKFTPFTLKKTMEVE